MTEVSGPIWVTVCNEVFNIWASAVDAYKYADKNALGGSKVMVCKVITVVEPTVQYVDISEA